MTTHTRPVTGRPALQRVAGHHLTHDHTVTGTATQLADLIAEHRSTGTFVAMTAPRPLAHDRFQVVIRLREQPTPQSVPLTVLGTHTRKVSRRTRIAVIVTAITGAVAGLVAVAVYLLGQLVELIAAHAAAILAVLALAAVLAALAARRSSGRRHCPGC